TACSIPGTRTSSTNRPEPLTNRSPPSRGCASPITREILSLPGLRSCSIRGDRALQVGQLLAREQADPAKRRQVLLGLRQVAHQQVGLADVLVSAAVARVELERSLVVFERGVELTEMPVREPEVVLQVGVLGVAQRGLPESLDRFGPVLALVRQLAGRVVGVAGRRLGLGLRRVREGRRRHADDGGHGHRRSRRDPRTQRWPRNAFARAVSGRTVSALLASATSFSKYPAAFCRSPAASAARAAPLSPRLQFGFSLSAAST